MSCRGTGDKAPETLRALTAERDALRARLAEVEAERDGWRAQAEVKAREARSCFDAQSEIDEAWDKIGTRGNKAHLSLPVAPLTLLALNQRAGRAMPPAPVIRRMEDE